jgi:hypothetical protein
MSATATYPICEKLRNASLDQRNLEISCPSPRLPENPCQWREPAEPQPGGQQMPGLIDLMSDPSGPIADGGVSDPTETCEQCQREDHDDRPAPVSAKANPNEDRREQQMPTPHPTETGFEQHRGHRCGIDRGGWGTRHCSRLSQKQRQR